MLKPKFTGQLKKTINRRLNAGVIQIILDTVSNTNPFPYIAD